MNKQPFAASKLILSIFICEFAGILGSLFSFRAISTWYVGLVKPALNPPSWIFGPVWSILYALMGTSAFLVWRQGWQRIEVKTALRLFGVQLVLNAIWSIIFFGGHSPFYALIDILALWILVLVTIIVFYRISKPAGYLLFPYLIWISFATYLNCMIYVLN